MYDAKTLPLSEQDAHFRRSLESIERNLVGIGEINPFVETIIRESTQKIIARANSLPSGEATEMLEGLDQIMNILGSRMTDACILTDIVTDPECVTPETLAKIVLSDRLNVSCNLGEALTPHVPEHLLPKYE